MNEREKIRKEFDLKMIPEGFLVQESRSGIFDQITFTTEPEKVGGRIFHQGELELRLPNGMRFNLNLWHEAKTREYDGLPYSGDGFMVHLITTDHTRKIGKVCEGDISLPDGVMIIETTDALSVPKYTKELWKKFVLDNVRACKKIEDNVGFEIPWLAGPDIVFQCISRDFAKRFEATSLSGEFSGLIQVLTTDYIYDHEHEKHFAIENWQKGREDMKEVIDNIMGVYYMLRANHLCETLAPLIAAEKPHEIWPWSYLANAIYSIQFLAWAPRRRLSGETVLHNCCRLATSTADIFAVNAPLVELGDIEKFINKRYIPYFGKKSYFIDENSSVNADRNAPIDMGFGGMVLTEETKHVLMLLKPSLLKVYGTFESDLSVFRQSYIPESDFYFEKKTFSINRDYNPFFSFMTFSDGVKGKRDYDRKDFTKEEIFSIMCIFYDNPALLRKQIYGEGPVADDVIAMLAKVIIGQECFL